MKELVALSSKMSTEKAVSEPLHKVIGLIACIVSNSLGAVVMLVLNGYGNDAMKIIRGIFEGAVTAGYLKRHPDQLKDFMDFTWVRQKRRLEFMKEHAPEQLQRISAEKMQETESQYNSIVDNFRNRNGKIRSSWCRVAFPQRAEEVGMGYLYKTFYQWASSMQHLDFSGLSSQTEAVSRLGTEQELFCDVAPSESWIEQSLVVGHGSVLLALNDYNEVAKLGFEAEVAAATINFKKAWQKQTP